MVLCYACIVHMDPFIHFEDPPLQCEHRQCILTVRHILVDGSYFAQTRNEAFGERDVVESFGFHHTCTVIFGTMSILFKILK